MRVVPLDRPREGHQRQKVFYCFIFDLVYLIRVQSSEPLHAKMNPTSCLFGSRFACAQTAILSTKLWSKNPGETSIVLWITAALWRILPSNKSAPSNRKTGFDAHRDGAPPPPTTQHKNKCFFFFFFFLFFY